MVASCVIKKIAWLILPLSKMFQKKQLEMFFLNELINSVPLALRTDKNNCKDFYRQIYKSQMAL